MIMKQVQHMLLQYFLFKFRHSFFVLWAGSKSQLWAYPFHQKNLVDLALLLRLHIIFIGTFFHSRQEYEPSHH